MIPIKGITKREGAALARYCDKVVLDSRTLDAMAEDLNRLLGDEVFRASTVAVVLYELRDRARGRRR